MSQQHQNDDVELDTKEAAAFLGCSPGTLHNDRIGKRRVPFVKTLGKIKYRLEDLRKIREYHPAAN